jgi:hypothetical protein
MSEKYPPTGQALEQYWFLRDGETGLHTFSRLIYQNTTTLFLRNLQESRTLFRQTNRYGRICRRMKFSMLPCRPPTQLQEIVVTSPQFKMQLGTCQIAVIRTLSRSPITSPSTLSPTLGEITQYMACSPMARLVQMDPLLEHGSL